MMNRLLLTLLLLFGTCTVAVADDLNDGIAAYRSNDYATAFAKFTKAAEAGDTGAQYCLSTLYYAGKGVPKDYAQAYMWANLAASKGGEREVENREAIATFMTPAQIAEAQKLAREWKPKK